jgi:hypothetical protein
MWGGKGGMLWWWIVPDAASYIEYRRIHVCIEGTSTPGSWPALHTCAREGSYLEEALLMSPSLKGSLVRKTVNKTFFTYLLLDVFLRMQEKLPMPSYQSSVYHLLFYQKTLNRQFDSLTQLLGYIEKQTTDPIYFGFCATALLMAHNFLDEYERYFKSADAITQKKINAVKRAVKPAIQEVKKWTGLRDFRNHVLAHNYRIKEKGYKSVFLDGELLAYHIPRSLSDLTLLIQCIDFIAKVIARYFQSDYDNFLQEMTAGRTRAPSACLSAEELTRYLNELNSKMHDGLLELAQKYGTVEKR